MPTVYKEVEVELDLSDFSDIELVEELNRRGLEFEINSQTLTEMITKIYELRRIGRDYQNELQNLIYRVTGRIA